MPRTLAAFCFAAFFAFLAALFSLRFLPTFFCSVVCLCFSPIPPAYALESWVVTTGRQLDGSAPT